MIWLRLARPNLLDATRFQLFDMSQLETPSSTTLRPCVPTPGAPTPGAPIGRSHALASACRSVGGKHAFRNPAYTACGRRVRNRHPQKNKKPAELSAGFSPDEQTHPVLRMI